MTAYYQLDSPDYEDDFHSERTNPVWIEPRYEIPCVIYPNGSYQGFGGRIRCPLPSSDLLEEFTGTRHIPWDEWLKERPRWAKLLGVQVEQITAGAAIGPPEGLLNGMPSADFIFPTFVIWVRTNVMEKLKRIGCTGVEFDKATFIYRGPAPFQFCDGCDAGYDPIDLDNLPDYWELVVTSNGYREGQYERRGRDPYGRILHSCPPFENVRIDEARWDGSDFFYLDEISSFLVVTDRVRIALEEIGATNYICKPLP